MLSEFLVSQMTFSLDWDCLILFKLVFSTYLSKIEFQRKHFLFITIQ